MSKVNRRYKDSECSDDQEVYRTLFEDTLDRQHRRALPLAYLRRPVDQDGVSVAFSENGAIKVSPNHCQGVAKHLVLW